MSIHTTITNSGIYFITFTCHRWLPLIEESDGYGAVYNFFQVLKQKGHNVVAYVIMPNHVHLLLHYSGSGSSLNTLMGNGRRFIAYELVKGLQQKGKTALLHQLQAEVLFKNREKGQQHCVWIDSFDVEQWRTKNF